ncbi:SHOCT domain-containing protein [Candidatus Aalborgicola defluviihabitans]|jgi:putative membrane protein|uniref:SHOCT domain-containing protein n=1 Tax=Candidatus Aalborgicola defluviihabitans TaxID=3386187 RepID=UPI0039B903F2
MHMFYDGNFAMGGMHGLWWIFWILLIGVLFVTNWGRSEGEGRRPRETPLEILQRRLANGEITSEEYEKRKTLLDRDAGSRA